MTFALAVFGLVTLLATASGLANAQSAPAWTPHPDVVGVWAGKADFMLPEGLTHQFHRFEFAEQAGPFLKGTHSWDILGENLKSHDGKEYTYKATEPLLGVIGQDGTILVIEHGNLTQFRMRFLNNSTLEFVAVEGGEHPVVGQGVRVRE